MMKNMKITKKYLKILMKVPVKKRFPKHRKK